MAIAGATAILASCVATGPNLDVIDNQDDSSRIFSITKGKRKTEADRILSGYKCAQFALMKFPKSFVYFNENRERSVSVVVLFDENDLVYSDVDNYIVSSGGIERTITKSDLNGTGLRPIFVKKEHEKP